MAINIKQEQLATLSESAKMLPRVGGKRIHASTLWRWCKKGLRGTKLEYLRVGSKIVTTSEALHRFFTTLAKLDENHPQSPTYKPVRMRNRPRSDASRQRALDDANAILVRAGIIKQSISAENGFSPASCR